MTEIGHEKSSHCAA